MEGYPAVCENIFFAKIRTCSREEVRIRNTTTEKDFKPTSDTILLLDLCTGVTSVEEIITTLSEKSGESKEELAGGVASILEILSEKGIITVRSTPLLQPRRAKEVTRKYPTESAQIELTNRCNLSCAHCFNNSGEPSPDELTTEEILSLINVLSRMGIHRITLTGGEPLLHPDFFRILEHARKAPMTVTVFTNGTVVTEEHIRKFKAFNVKIAVSLDSFSAETHDHFRGKKGAFEKTLKSITLFKKAGLPMTISVSLNKLNKDEIVDTIKFFRENDLKTYQVAEVNISGRGIDEVVITPQEYYETLLKKLTFEKAGTLRTPKTSPPKRGDGCGIARDLIYITADGTILPCHACHKDMGVGNIRDVNLPVFWDTDETLEMLRSIRAEDDSTCKTCRYLKFCDGCVANAFISSRTVRSYDPYVCARQKAYDEAGFLG